MRRPKITVKQLVGIGSIVGTISIGSLITFNEEHRTTVQNYVKNVRDRVVRVTTQRRDTVFTAAPPEVVEVLIADPSLAPVTEDDIDQAFREAVQALQLEFEAVSRRFETVDEALDGIDADEQARHEVLVARVEEVAAMKLETPIVYVVIDSFIAPVPIDSLHGSEGWLRLLYPLLKRR